MFSRFHAIGKIAAKIRFQPTNLKNSFHSATLLQSNFHANASHRPSNDNTPETYWDFTAENYERVSRHFVVLMCQFLQYIYFVYLCHLIGELNSIEISREL